MSTRLAKNAPGVSNLKKCTPQIQLTGVVASPMATAVEPHFHAVSPSRCHQRHVFLGNNANGCHRCCQVSASGSPMRISAATIP
ncbi:MAG: hypothetical protein BWX86_01739 [Verrucomicrobia bacterium ADurb.Bin122]|nr:MAG: hypothetical protein BWX86_01739 [Verrucomicrobia bacterium ADurb.Bin122]